MAKRLKEMEIIGLDKAYQKVLYWFFSFPNIEIGLNDLASSLRISKTTAKKIIFKMVKEDFLNKNVYGKTWRIKCNISHKYNFTRKTAFNMAMVSEYYEKELKHRIFEIVGNAKSVVLFGSYRKGDDTEKSDIDIAAEVIENRGVRLIELGEIIKFGFRKNVKVNLHIFSKDSIDLNLFSNIANGIVLEGFLEVRP